MALYTASFGVLWHQPFEAWIPSSIDAISVAHKMMAKVGAVRKYFWPLPIDFHGIYFLHTNVRDVGWPWQCCLREFRICTPHSSMLDIPPLLVSLGLHIGIDWRYMANIGAVGHQVNIRNNPAP